MALKSQTSTFAVRDPAASPDTYIVVDGVRTINNLRSGTATEIDVSDLSSTEKEFILGLADPGSMDLEMLYNPDDPGQIILENLRVSSDIENFRVSIPNTSGSPQIVTFTFAGFVQTFPFSIGVDTAISGTVTIRVTGAITKA